MAFYEMLPGAGMPPGLQAGMDSVLNKKFVTSTTYPAEDWPDTVNLMGPLLEKTASGAVVTFPDGADAVPLKKCEITLPASLDGYSEVDVVATGKNLFNVADYSQIYTDRDGVDSYNYHYMIIQLKPNTTYTVSQNSGEYSGTPIILINNVLPVGGANYFDLRKASDTKTYTTDSTGRLYIGSVNSYDDVAYERLQACKVQIEAGSTASTFEPYSGTTHTASLGRTIYGGSVDVVAGEGESSYKIITVGNSGWNYYASGGYIYKDFNDKVTPTIGDTDHVLVTDNPDMPYGGVNYASQFQDLHVYQAQNKAIYIKDTSCTSVNDFYTKYSDMQIGYELATPETFTFDPVPIDSKLGNNTIWSEQGDTDVTYRSQGTAYIYPNAEEASF